MTRPLIADDFVGEWQLDRLIADRTGAQSGTFKGQADFRATGDDTLAYDETSEISKNSTNVVFCRRRSNFILLIQRDSEQEFYHRNSSSFSQSDSLHDLSLIGMSLATQR